MLRYVVWRARVCECVHIILIRKYDYNVLYGVRHFKKRRHFLPLLIILREIMCWI